MIKEIEDSDAVPVRFEEEDGEKYPVADYKLMEQKPAELCEMDLSEDGNISPYRKSITAWKMIYTAMEEMKRVMDETAKNKGGIHNIGTEDVQMILGHIENTIDNCLSSTLPQLRKQG
jgi:hypothetical protein